MKSKKFNLTETDLLAIKYLGLFGSLSQKQLKYLTKISLCRLEELVSREYIWRPSKSNRKTYVYDKNGNKILLYILKKNGLMLLKKYYPDIIFTRSRSLEHDYNNAINLINYATKDELSSYQSERVIRKSYGDTINNIENIYNIKISCPDGYFIRDGQKIFIETIHSYSKSTLENKKNFSLCLEDGEELIVIRFGKEIYKSQKGGDSNE